jgi:hypothetical protein
LPLRQYLVRARLAAGAVRNPGSRLHLLVSRGLNISESFLLLTDEARAMKMMDNEH